MDHFFTEIVGKPRLQPPKIITIVADNFSFLEDQSQFLKATFAIPEVKQLPFGDGAKRLIQIGPLQQEIGNQVRKDKWILHHHLNHEENICDEVGKDLSSADRESIVFINDVSKLELISGYSDKLRRLLRDVHHARNSIGCFVVALYQNSNPVPNSRFLRDLEYISDAVAHIKSCKAGYFTNFWWQLVPTTATLIPRIVETNYYTFKIGKYYYSPELLCFYERKKVAKNYDLETDTCLSVEEGEEDDQKDGQEHLTDMLGRTSLDRTNEDLRDSTLPYTQAQNPEQSRIFYYPDKEDDIDEDDPDNDLGI